MVPEEEPHHHRHPDREHHARRAWLNLCYDLAGSCVEAPVIVIEHEGRCGDGREDDCPICRGEMSDEFVAMIQQAAAAEPGPSMSAEEFLAWLDGLDVGSPHRVEIRRLGRSSAA